MVLLWYLMVNMVIKFCPDSCMVLLWQLIINIVTKCFTVVCGFTVVCYGNYGYQIRKVVWFYCGN